MSANLLSYAGWTFLPNLVTGWVQTIYYGITVRAGDPKPQPGSVRYMKHRRRIHILVISAYLLYTIYEADWEIRRKGDFYQDLGLVPDVEEKEIKSRFRRLAALHHPDKATSAEARGASEGYFVHLKLAQDTLLDPAKRFAYDRFGPDMVQWRHCTSVRDYVLVGVQSIAPYYAASALFMIILGVLGYLEWGHYWRYLSVISLMTFEFHTITRPYYLPFASKLLNPFFTRFTSHPPLLPFQQLILARKFVLTLFIAFSQLGPLLQKSRQQHAKGPQQDLIYQYQQLNRLDQIARISESQSNSLLNQELAPFAFSRGDDEHELARIDLRTRIKQWAVQSKVRHEPEVRHAVQRVVAERSIERSDGLVGTS